MLCQAEATRCTDAWTTFANVEKTWAYRQDQLPSTHPVAADMPDVEAVEVNFDGITYAKGASVLKQLVAYVGIDAFLAGAARLLRASTPTATPRFADLLGRAGGGLRPRPVATGRSQWLETAGVNTLRPEFDARRRRPLRQRSTVVQTARRPAHPTLRTAPARGRPATT